VQAGGCAGGGRAGGIAAGRRGEGALTFLGARNRGETRSASLQVGLRGGVVADPLQDVKTRRGHVGVDSLVLSPRHGRSVAGEEGIDVGRVGGDCGARAGGSRRAGERREAGAVYIRVLIVSRYFIYFSNIFSLFHVFRTYHFY
jgi:hypothetical protein